MSGHLIDGFRRRSSAPARLTGVRQEIKYLVTASDGARIRSEIAKILPAKLHDGSAFSFRASAYLDVENRELAKATLRSGAQAIKLRVKDYYLVDRGRPTCSERVWLEVKARAGTMVEKSRFSVFRVLVGRILAVGPGPGSDSADAAAREAFAAVQASRRLEPIVLSHYRRFTYQDPDSRMRVTFDDALSFHAPPPGLFDKAVPVLARQYLPPPLASESGWVIEIKSLGPLPLWIEEILAKHQTADYSKFTAGVRALRNASLIDIEET